MDDFMGYKGYQIRISPNGDGTSTAHIARLGETADGAYGLIEPETTVGVGTAAAAADLARAAIDARGA